MDPIEYEQAKMIRCIRIAYRIWKEFEDWLSEEKKPTKMDYVNDFGEAVKSINRAKRCVVSSGSRGSVPAAENFRPIGNCLRIPRNRISR